jgi:hypothetical protein
MGSDPTNNGIEQDFIKPGDFEINTPKKIESFKYSYLHNLKLKRGKKGEGCKSGLQKQGLKPASRYLLSRALTRGCKSGLQKQGLKQFFIDH